ncbi:MAG: hypothetical protein GTO41_20340, partial [Burkholderiales bacterium]|nr:hypothetical protein [Burkholderiales bacterium]
MAYFALIFPTRHPLVQRYPRLTPVGLYASHGLAILAAMVLARSWTAALSLSNRASWAVALAQLGLAVAAGVRS